MKKFALGLFLAAFLAGCTPVDSLNPLYTPGDIVVDEGLEGTWVTPEKPEDGFLTITRTGFQLDGRSIDGYSIVMKDSDGTTSRYEGYLLKINGQLFLDVVTQQWDAHTDSFPLHLTHSKEQGAGISPRLLRLGLASYLEFTENSPEANAQIIAKLRPAHWFFKVMRTNDQLVLPFMDDEVVRKGVEAGKIKLANSIFRKPKTAEKIRFAPDADIVLTADTKDLQKFVAEHVNDQELFPVDPDTKPMRKAKSN